LNVSPNPVPNGDLVNISFNLPKTGKIRLELFNFSGLPVSKPFSVLLSEGNHLFRFKPEIDLTNGFYYLKLSLDDKVLATKKFIIH
jgi:hypothetical protein